MHDDQLASAADAQAGLAHVATASFLASRVVPTGGYAVALAGGVALARAAQLAGMRLGYGVSLAAMLQSIAVLGPSRISVPLTQALSAPLLGRLHEHGAHLATQIGACAAIRAGDQTLFTLFYIWIVGGVEAYAATYDVLAGRIPGVPDGTTAALLATALVLVAWTAFASVVQVLTYRAALRGWPPAASSESSAATAGAEGEPDAAAMPRGDRAGRRQPRYDARAVALAALVAFAVLLATTEWLVLAGVSGWLAVAWLTARADASPLRAGLALAVLLGAGVLAFGLIGGLDTELTLRRTLRAVLLVLVATWLRAAAGEAGVRETARRTLWRLRRMPAMAEAAHVLDRLGAGGALGASGRALVAQVHGVRRRPVPLARAVLRWVAAEARAFRAPPPAAAHEVLRTTWRDAVLLTAVIGLVVAAVLSSG